MKKWKNFLWGLLAFVCVILTTFLLVSFIVANIRDMRVVDLWQNWGHAINHGWNKIVDWAKK